MFRLILGSVAMLLAAPAAADVTGRYSGPDGGIVTVEVNADGSIRFEPEGAGSYQIFRGEEGYIVELHDGRPVVMRWDDLTAHFDAELTAVLGGLPDAETQAEPEGPRESLLIPGGSETVEGRLGKRYVARDEAERSGPALVISVDPALRPLGRAWQAVIARVPSFGAGLFAPSADVAAEISSLFATGAPLQLGEIRLVGVSEEDVPPERFALPAEPLSRAQLAEFVRARREGQASGE